MNYKALVVIVLAVMVLLSCTSYQALRHKTVDRNGEKILFGITDKEQVFFDFPEWEKLYNSYIPEPGTIKALSAIATDFSIEVFFGTWCSDSRRDVPHFFKVMDASGLSSKIKSTIYAVDRSKQTTGKIASDRNIERVATFIFYRNEKEIGRITEFPDDTIEEDMLVILRSQ